jgi:hypothetical protein
LPRLLGGLQPIPAQAEGGGVTACYVCKQYVYGRPRHRECEPAYRRIRIFSCEVCGKMARGRRHRRCDGFIPKGYRACEYCFGPTRAGRFHNACQPDKGEYAMFADLPEIIQRRCSACREWFPFASMTGEQVNDAFSPHGRAKSGRPTYVGQCRACLSEMRRERERKAA